MPLQINFIGEMFKHSHDEASEFTFEIKYIHHRQFTSYRNATNEGHI
jgi:hypothetical protein